MCANDWNIGGVNETGVVVEARQAKGMEGEGTGVKAWTRCGACCGVCAVQLGLVLDCSVYLLLLLGLMIDCVGRQADRQPE